MRPVRAPGTVRTVFRVGERLCVRLPQRADWAQDLEREDEAGVRRYGAAPISVVLSDG